MPKTYLHLSSVKFAQRLAKSRFRPYNNEKRDSDATSLYGAASPLFYAFCEQWNRLQSEYDGTQFQRKEGV